MMPTLASEEIFYTACPPGILEPEHVQRVYNAFKSSEVLPLLFWAEQHLPDAKRGSLSSLAMYFYHYPSLLFSNAEQTKFLGAAWFYSASKLRAHLSICYCRGVHPNLTRACTRAAFDYGFLERGWRYIWGESPWRSVTAHARSVGAKLIATLPDYVMIEGRPRPLYITRRDQT